MYIPTPAQAVETMSATFIPNGDKSYLDLATTASNAAKKLLEIADQSTGERKEKALAAARATKKRSDMYIKLYMAGSTHNPMPRVAN